MAITDVLVESAVSQSDTYNDGQTERNLQRLGVLIDEIDLDVLYARGPPVEAEDLIRERDALLGSDIMDLLAGGAAAG